jgi:hypothetical protein
MERLVREEADAPITSGACGGAHRLMALSHAVASCVANGMEVDGQWARADAIVTAYLARARQIQNVDGSYSTEFFTTRAEDSSMTRRLYSTGHILEWMSFSLPKEDLSDSRVTKAVDYMVDAMLSAPDFEIDVGPRGHALHALMLYEEKVFGRNSQQIDLASSRNRYESLKSKYPSQFERTFSWNQSFQIAKEAVGSPNEPTRSRRGSGVFRRR